MRSVGKRRIAPCSPVQRKTHPNGFFERGELAGRVQIPVRPYRSLNLRVPAGTQREGGGWSVDPFTRTSSISMIAMRSVRRSYGHRVSGGFRGVYAKTRQYQPGALRQGVCHRAACACWLVLASLRASPTFEQHRRKHARRLLLLRATQRHQIRARNAAATHIKKREQTYLRQGEEINNGDHLDTD